MNAVPGKFSKRAKARLRPLNALWKKSPTKETRTLIRKEAEALFEDPAYQKHFIGMATSKKVVFTDPKPKQKKEPKGNPYEHNPAFPDRR